MSMNVATFRNRINLLVGTYKWYANLSNEMNAVRVALGADATTRDTTMQTAPTGLQPGNRSQTGFTNALLQEVNKGKAGNLSTITMANLIGGAMPGPSAPVNITPPNMQYQSGGAGAGTQPGAIYIRASAGTWDPPGPSLTQQWMRSGAAIAGQTAVSYTTVAADAGTTLSCNVTGTNSGGSSTVTASGAAAIT